jgi:hypothetical protein
MADYVPKKDGKFEKFFKFMLDYTTQRVTQEIWTHIPQPALTKITGAYNTWYTAYAATAGPHTKVDTAAKDNAKDAAIKVIRPFVNQYLRFPPVTDEDRIAMGIRNPNPHPTPVKPPKEGPFFSIVQMGPALLGIVSWYGETGRKGSKPPGMTGAEVHYGVPAGPITDQEELPAMVWATRCPHVIRFRESDRGKRAFFALKWGSRKENCESGWSEIQSEIVP